MSQLYLSEAGRVVHTLGEELTTFRRARKTLQLPPTVHPATLYVLARPYAETSLSLRVAVNGNEIPAIMPERPGSYNWYAITLDDALLRAGANSFDLWTDGTAMNGWSLAIEPGHRDPASYVSDDGGRSWRNERMSYLSVLRGEYVVRLRLAEGHDPTPPAMVREDPTHPRAASLRRIMPQAALEHGPLLGRVRALSSWLSSSWEHTSWSAQYCPWDAETILAWGPARVGHAGQRPIVMCVHYAAAFVSCCQAVGIPARCAVTMGTLNGSDGHFVAEVWFDEYGKWVLVDPNLDAILWKNGVPLSVSEVQAAGTDLGSLVEWGPGTAYQRQYPHVVEFIEDNFLRGLFIRHRSIWARADFLSHPELTPPGHGSLAYCETDLVWETCDMDRGFGMFPYFGEASYFDAPPAVPR
jgi:transglutaminase-like putative cysteine protease